MLIYPTIKMSPLLGLQGLGGGLGRLAGSGGLPQIGDAYEGGFFAGYISHTANGVATHGLIVAPNASGTNGGSAMQLRNSQTSTGGTFNMYDGASNTANASNSDHPAGQYCNNLSIGGYSDWYLPAMLELEIAYYNLRPTGVNNQESAFSRGTNDYSVPQRTDRYTTSNPPQTSVSIFQTGGSEAFDYNTSSGTSGKYHWASTQLFASSGDNYLFNFYNNTQGGDRGKTVLHQVRAFRKFAV